MPERVTSDSSGTDAAMGRAGAGVVTGGDAALSTVVVSVSTKCADAAPFRIKGGRVVNGGVGGRVGSATSNGEVLASLDT